MKTTHLIILSLFLTSAIIITATVITDKALTCLLYTSHAHITVAGAMGAVAADGIFFIHLIRHAVHIRLFGHGLVEGCLLYTSRSSLRPCWSVR